MNVVNRFKIVAVVVWIILLGLVFSAFTAAKIKKPTSIRNIYNEGIPFYPIYRQPRVSQIEMTTYRACAFFETSVIDELEKDKQKRESFYREFGKFVIRGKNARVTEVKKESTNLICAYYEQDSKEQPSMEKLLA